jgi:hypothetical protein
VGYGFAGEPKGSYLHVRVTGDNTAENVRRYLGDILAACAEHRCSRVLIEENLLGPSLNTMQMFSIASQGSVHALTVVTAIAYVDVNPEHDRHLLRFAESVALNRGLLINTFATVAHAAEWTEMSAPASISSG